jgi:hypothetical protein
MAYKSKLWLKCSVHHCTKNASYKVCNKYNAEIGRYCSVHAEQKVKEVSRYE